MAEVRIFPSSQTKEMAKAKEVKEQEKAFIAEKLNCKVGEILSYQPLSPMVNSLISSGMLEAKSAERFTFRKVEYVKTKYQGYEYLYRMAHFSMLYTKVK